LDEALFGEPAPPIGGRAGLTVSWPTGGAPRGDGSQWRGGTAVPTPFGGEEPTSSQGRSGRAAGPFSPKSPRGGRVGQVEPGPVDLAVLGWQGRSDEAPFVACRGLARGWRSSWRWSSRPFGAEMARVGGTAPRFFLVIIDWWHLRVRLFLRVQHGFRAHRTAGDRQPRSHGGFHDLLERWRILGACRAGGDLFSPSGAASGVTPRMRVHFGGPSAAGRQPVIGVPPRRFRWVAVE
jgi:hypothetical protein